VQVDEQVRIDLVEQPEQRPRLGRVGLDEVAVQVEAHAVRPSPDRVGAVLAAAVADLDRLVAVDVVDWHEPDAAARQQRLVLAERDLAQQLLDRLFALDLAGVDVADHHDAELGRGVGVR